MPEFIQKIKNLIPNHERTFKWIKLVTVTGSSQFLIQAIGLISGILIIRVLPIKEYALYTLANTMLGTMSVLSDGGIGTGVMAEGGKVWNDREKLGAVLATGLDLRKKFSFFSLIVSIPILLYFLRHNGGSWLISILIVLAIIPTFLMALSGVLHDIALKLQQDIIQLQKIQIGVNIGRITILLSTLFFFPWAFIALLGVGIPQIWANIKIRKVTNSYANWNQKPDKVVRHNILVMVKRLLPDAVYYCFSGQITIFIISFLGNNSNLAKIGALSRITAVLSLFLFFFNTLIAPRFARLPNIKSLLLKRYILIQIVLVLLSLTIILFAWLFSSQILSILGNQYLHLETELLLSIISSCIVLIYGVSFSLCTYRGWVINPVIFISCNVIALILCIKFLDVSSLRGVLKLNIVVSSIQLVIYLLYCLIKIGNVKDPQIMSLS